MRFYIKDIPSKNISVVWDNQLNKVVGDGKGGMISSPICYSASLIDIEIEMNERAKALVTA